LSATFITMTQMGTL